MEEGCPPQRLEAVAQEYCVKSTNIRCRGGRGFARILAGCIAVLLVEQARSEEVWIGKASGNWSTHANWLDGSAPASSGGSTLAVRFTGESRTGITATNDLGDAFTLNKLILDHGNASPLTIAIYGDSALRFTGVAPVIQIDGAGDTVLSGNLQLGASSGTLTFRGSGVGNLTIDGRIRESSPGQGLVIDASPPSWNAQVITLLSYDMTDFSGDVTLQRGNLAVSETLGRGVLKIHGGTLRGASSLREVANAISLGTDLIVTGSNDLRLTGVISSATADTGLSLRARRTGVHGRAPILTLLGNSTYTGPTTIDYDPSSATAHHGGGIIELIGSGSLLSSSRYEIRGGGMLRWSGTDSRNALGDSTPVRLQSGQLYMNVSGFGSLPHTETAGPLTISGASTITIAAAVDRSATFALKSLTRSDRGTVLFRGTALGTTPAPNVANVVFSTAPAGLVGANGTGVNRSILPYAIGDTIPTGSGNSFVTYSPTTGIRPLDLAAEYATNLPTGVSTANVRLGSNATLTSNATVNSLILPSGVSLLGNAKLSVTSGAVMTLGSITSIYTPLSFGSAEANIFAISNLTLFGALTGSNGFTKSGDGTLTLGGDNGISGPLTINAGKVAFSSAANLGSGTSSIVLNGVNPALAYQGAETFTLSRPVEIQGGIGRIESSGATLIISQPITGNGGLEIGRGQGGVVRTLSQNTYSGPTILSGGTLEIGNDASLGQGGLFFAPNNHYVASLRLLGDWTTSREVRLEGDGTIDTAGFDASLSGVLTGSESFQKKGDGTLTLSASSPFSGELLVSGGSFRLAGLGQTRSSMITLQSGGRLILDNSTTVLPHRLASTAAVTLAHGELRIIGNGATASAETLTGLTVYRGMSIVTLQVPGSAPVTLHSDAFSQTAGYLLVRGDRLGGASGTAYSRFVLPAAPASASGFLDRIYASEQASGGGESLAVYDSNVDSAGTIGVKPLPASAYTASADLTNPAVPESANFLVSGVVTTGAPKTAVHSLTLNAGSSLNIGAGKTLAVGSRQIVARSGGSASAITGGGVLDFGAATGTVAVFGDFTMDVAVAGRNGWVKTGPGTLTLGAQPATGARLIVNAGAVKPLAEASLREVSIEIDTRGTLQIDGANADVGGVSGYGTLALNSSTLTIGTLASDFFFPGSVTGNGTLKIVDGGNPNAVRTFASSSPLYSGNIDLRSGLLGFPSAGSLGSGIIEANGGGLHINGPLKQSIVLNSDLRIRGNGTTIEGAVSVGGPGGLSVESVLETTVKAPLAYTGETRVAADLRLDGVQGALTGTSAIRVTRSGRFMVDERSSGLSNINRIPDTAPVWLEGGSMYYLSRYNGASSETFGNLHVKGFGQLEIYQSSLSSPVTLRAARLVREGRATMEFRNIKDIATENSAATQMFFQTAPTLVGGTAATGPATGIIPWAYSPSGGFVTYSSTTGIRTLTSADFANGPAAVTAPTNNLMISSETVLDSSLTVNSLFLNFSSSSNARLSGSGTLRITSGAVLSGGYSGMTTVSTPLDFGEQEALIIADVGTISLAGTISGTGGLTKSGSRDVFLAGTNSFSGPISINKGLLYFSSPENLGTGSSPISLYGGTRLVYSGSRDITLDRPFRLEEGSGGISPQNRDVTVRLSGEISGNGDLSIGGQGTTILAGTNTYTGATYLYGNTVITSDAALGNGGPLYLYGYQLRTEAPWSTERRIILANGASIDTGEHDVVLNGPLTGTYSLAKSGIGSLTIRDAENFHGRLTVGAGTVVLEGNVRGGTSEIEISVNGRLTGAANIDRPLNSYGTLAPGLGVGTMIARDVRLRANSKLELELLSAEQYDRLFAEGMVRLDGQVQLSLNLQFDPVDDVDSFLVIDNDGSDPVLLNNGAGKFAYMGSALNEGAFFQSGEQMFRISYQGGDGNDVVLYAVPEPGAGTALLMGLGVIAMRRLRRGERV